MKKIKDIVANTTSYGENYILDNQLVGRILLNENKTFEGIVFNEGINYLVIGELNEEKLEMIQKTDSSDKLYKVKREGKTFYGDCFIKENNFEYPVSECLIDIMEPGEIRKKYEQEEIKELEEQIKLIKTTKK